jgi:hypothetical protein
VYNQFHSSYGVVSDADKMAMKINSPHPVNNNVTTHSAQDAYERVLKYSGASLKQDAVDIRIIDNVRKKTFTAQGSKGSTNGIIDSQTDVGGWPQLNSSAYPSDVSNDGIPDEWQKSKKLDPDKMQANGRDLSSAYDNIELYINSLVSNITDVQNK